MNLVVDTELPPAARWALDELRRALRARGESVETAAAVGPDPGFIIGLAGRSPRSRGCPCPLRGAVSRRT